VAATLEAALQVLVTNGAEGLTTTRVAERAGVSVGTLYPYFPDKRALVVALRVRYVDGLVAHVGAAMRDSIGLSAEAALRSVITALLAFERDNLLHAVTVIEQQRRTVEVELQAVVASRAYRWSRSLLSSMQVSGRGART